MPAPYTLTDPCTHCPFRTDTGQAITAERAADLAEDISTTSTFYCHQTLPRDNDDEAPRHDGTPDVERLGTRTRACAGALIVLEKSHQASAPMRMGQALGLYDPNRLNMDAPTYDTLNAWVQSHR